ncbi:MAG: 3-deoxy-manno-octulosonate cytidylyltransferase [Candidatus Cloacimonetes bacterium]|nr:3-deoxy-manno-octulosonate cytidylyltransferase [Candidatus Cloacimonadota bacterium]
MRTAALIPARYESTRFPGKPLVTLCGIPLIRFIQDRIRSFDLFDHVIVATDSPLIYDEIVSHGGTARMTRKDHPSGSDRIAEVAGDINAEVIVNVQGDEPLIDAGSLRGLLYLFCDNSIQIASLMTALSDPAQLTDPNTVKVVTGLNGDALYFSRAPIPHRRDSEIRLEIGRCGKTPLQDNTRCENPPLPLYLRHIGVYAYRREALLQMVSLPPSPLEEIEKLEQLRLLQNGIPIRMLMTDYQGIGIDTPDDLTAVRKILGDQS